MLAVETSRASPQFATQIRRDFGSFDRTTSVLLATASTPQDGFCWSVLLLPETLSIALTAERSRFAYDTQGQVLSVNFTEGEDILPSNYIPIMAIDT